MTQFHASACRCVRPIGRRGENRWGLLPAILLTALALNAQALEHPATVAGGYPAQELFNTTTDVLGRTLEYPDCPALFHSVIITMQPGQVGAVHQHLTPLYGYVLSGKISVTYEKGDGITNTYSAGEAFMEAMDVMHHGFNPFDEPVTLLAVYMNCVES